MKISDALLYAVEGLEAEIHQHLSNYGPNYRPARLQAHCDQLAEVSAVMREFIEHEDAAEDEACDLIWWNIRAWGNPAADCFARLGPTRMVGRLP